MRDGEKSRSSVHLNSNLRRGHRIIEQDGMDMATYHLIESGYRCDGTHGSRQLRHSEATNARHQNVHFAMPPSMRSSHCLYRSRQLRCSRVTNAQHLNVHFVMPPSMRSSHCHYGTRQRSSATISMFPLITAACNGVEWYPPLALMSRG